MKLTARILLGFVSAIFVAKYSSRLGVPGIVFGAFYLLAFVGMASALTRLASPSRTPQSGKFLVAAVAGISLVALIAVFLLPAGSRVGRFPAIEVWLSDFLAGIFPYHAPNQPSGFPMLFILALPARALGNVGLLEVLGIVLFGATLVKRDGAETGASWVPLALLLLLPSFYYEVIVRSELFFNMTLVLALIVFTDEILAAQEGNWKSAGVAVLFGLLLSTRSIIGIVYVIYVLLRFRREPLKGAIFTAVVLLVFALTLIPFVIWNRGLFQLHGPFSIQFAYLPFWIILSFLGLAGVAGSFVRGLREALFASGVLLFAIVFVAFLLAVNQEGFSTTLSMDRFDISYFVFCTPFLLYTLDERRI